MKRGWPPAVPIVLSFVAFALVLAGAFRGSAADAPAFTALEAPGLHNVFRLGPRVLSGSSPEGDEAFAALQRLGVKTIVSVDGTKPDVEAARRHGIRYVHLPHGYDGIGTNVQLRLIQAAETLPGPVFVHCHHGKHRGPTAAAVICLAREGWTPEQAETFLQAAGTSTNYAGLYEVVRRFHAPTPEELRARPVDLPEVSPVPGLVEAMVGIDERWENLKSVRQAGYRAPKEHPDLQPANEAGILREHFRESRRLPESARRGADFLGRLESAEREAQAAEEALRRLSGPPGTELRTKLDGAFETIGRSCTSCHRAHRDSVPASVTR